MEMKTKPKKEEKKNKDVCITYATIFHEALDGYTRTMEKSLLGAWLKSTRKKMCRFAVKLIENMTYNRANEM